MICLCERGDAGLLPAVGLRLDLRWHCIDHDFGMFPERGEKRPRAAPTFGC
jgi:hypothetical protein